MIKINAACRSVVINDRMGAAVVTGTDKIRSGFGNGDCLLMDFERRVFAVADSSERYSRGSRDLLERFAGGLSGPVRPRGEAGWLEYTNRIYGEQKYQHKTTFSCVVMNRENGEPGTYIIHGGDSMVCLINRKSGEVDFQTEPDMKFAGRTTGLTDVRRLPLDGDYRIILATDGMSDLARLMGESFKGMLLSRFSGILVHEVPGTLFRLLDECTGRGDHDDIGLIAFDPGEGQYGGGISILMGGTTPQEEHLYQRELRELKIRDEWISPAGRGKEIDELARSGIHISRGDK